MDVNQYRLQLAQVDAALTHSPGDDDLIKLKADLEEIIKVSTELHVEEQAGAVNDATSPATPGFSVGDAVVAIYKVDGLVYPATVTKAVPGAGVVTVQFSGYNNIEEVPINSVAYPQDPQEPAQPKSDAVISAAPHVVAENSQSVTVTEQSAQEALELAAQEVRKKLAIKKKRDKQRLHREERKKRDEIKTEERKKEVSAWKKFNSSSKRGHGAFKGAKNKKSSIFASPTTVDGRVGVIGSDKKMTANIEGRKKHVFQKSHIPDNNDDDLE